MMLGARHASRVVWRRRHATRHYVGYVLVTDKLVRLAGNEQDTAIHAVLSIPPQAIEVVRVGQTPDEHIVGEPAVVIELTDDDPIYLRPITTGALGLDELARKLASISDRRTPAAQSPSSPCSIA
jgi:hypothetical protein